MCLLCMWVWCVVCRITTIQADHNHISLDNGSVRSTEVLQFQTIKIGVADVDRLLEPALGQRIWHNRQVIVRRTSSTVCHPCRLVC